MEIAIFKNIELDFETIEKKSFEDVPRYVRMSEYIDIDFVMLKPDTVAAKEVSILKDAKKKIQAETELKLNNIDRKIGELLALPAPPQDKP